MKKVSDEELMNVNGGGFNLGIATGIVGCVAFLIGVFDGIVRPLKCR